MKDQLRKSLESKEDTGTQHFVIGNDFHISDVIDGKYPELILKPLRAKINEQAAKQKKDTLRFFINSHGGRVDWTLSTLALFQECAALGIPVETYIVGMAYSAAAIIAISGSTRYAYPFTSLMFHSMRMSYWAHNGEMIGREAEWYLWADKQLAGIIESRTKIKKAIELMKPVLYYVNGAAEMKKLGCIDQIV